MNKRKKVAKIKMDNVNHYIIEIVELFHDDYAPLECFLNQKIVVEEMTSWFR